MTSKAVRNIGSAVVFLHWCYEAVQRDGTIDVQIADVAEYLEESYYTVRKWWSVIKDGPWFVEVHDRGKRGFKVRMADDWLSWRPVRTSVPSTNGQMQNTVLEEDTEVPNDALNDDEMPVKLPSNASEMQNRAFDGRMYKVLQDDQESGVVGAFDKAPDLPPPKEKKRRADEQETPPRQSKPPTPEVIRTTLAEVCGINTGRAGLRADKLEVNQTAGLLWDEYQKQGKTPDDVSKLIRYVAKWCLKNAWECTKNRPPDAPNLPRPTHIRRYWTQAEEAYWVAQNGHRKHTANGTHRPTDLADGTEISRLFRKADP